MDSDYISHSEKYDEELLSEGMIANAKLLSNDKYEFDNIMMIFGDRLKIIPNGTSRISKKIKINCFNDRYVYRILFKPLCYKGHKDDFRDSIFELSNITTALFSYNTSNREYIGLEQLNFTNHKDDKIGEITYYFDNELLIKEDVILNQKIKINLIKVLKEYYLLLIAFVLLVILSIFFIKKRKKKSGKHVMALSRWKNLLLLWYN